MGNKLADVVIPVFKPKKELDELLLSLKNQTIQPIKVVLMITKSECMVNIPNIPGLNIESHEINQQDFDHAKTRNEGISYCTSEFVLLLTQDVQIEDHAFIEKLLAPMNEQVIVSFARQLPKKEASCIEIETRSFNYPDKSCVHKKNDLEHLGIKTYFMSDVACLYNRQKFWDLGGFDVPAIFNEDMVFAAKVIEQNYLISYTAEASIFHSHNLSLKMAFKRQFDLGVSQKQHPEVFSQISSEKEGASMVNVVTKNLWKKGKVWAIPIFYVQCASKYAGYLFGKNYTKLSIGLRKKFSLNKTFWEE